MSADVHALAGAYALDALPADERAFFERHLAVCEACSTEVAELGETAARLGSAAATTPPPDLRARILAAADVTRQLPPEAPPVPEVQRGWQGLRGRLLMPVAACLALVAVGLTGVSLNLSRELDSTRQELARNAGAAQQVARAEAVAAVVTARDFNSVDLELGSGTPGRFLVSPSQDQGVLVGEGMADPAQGKTYELWLIHDGTPVPAGLFDPDSDGQAIAAVDGIVRDAERVAVTIEPQGGSKKPTGSIIASAEM